MFFNIDEILSIFIIIWAVVDPIGTVPVFIAITKKYDSIEKRNIAYKSTFIAFAVLLFFMFIGNFILRHVGVPLSAFQISGGIILFLFANSMIFGSSKPEEEIELAKEETETAIFPLAIPSIASPGAILAVVLLADTNKQSYASQFRIIFALILVLGVNYFFMRTADKIHHKIGNSGAIIISKIMGLILASMAANNILLGIRTFFKIA